MVASLDVCFRARATFPHPHHLPGIPRRATGMLRYLEALVVLIGDILPSISLQINRRRKAFRGHKPRRQPERGRLVGRLAELQKNALGSVLVCIYIHLRWSRASLKGVTTPTRFERPTVVHAILPGKGDPQDASISCRVLASAPFLHQASSLSDPSCSLFLSHFRLLVAYFISRHLVL